MPLLPGGDRPYWEPMARAGRPDQPNAAERFNEERATYTVKGSQPDLEAGVAAIREVHATLKPKPGVYRMLDARGEVRLAEPLSETELQAARRGLPVAPEEMAQTSPRRVVSLRRLEAALDRRSSHVARAPRIWQTDTSVPPLLTPPGWRRLTSRT